MVHRVSFPFVFGTYNRWRLLCISADEPQDSIVSLARRLDCGNFPLAQVGGIAQSEVMGTDPELSKVGIQFVQIGNDKVATEFLKELDDALSGTHGVRVS